MPVSPTHDTTYDHNILKQRIDMLWESRQFEAEDRHVLQTVLRQVDQGELSVVYREKEGTWTVNTWVKKAISLFFAVTPSAHGQSGEHVFYDKVPLKFSTWTEQDFKTHQIRVVPGAIVRHGAYIAPGAVLMPCFINVGAFVGDNTMIDAGARVGSCAYVGKNCHISGGVGLGGVLEPPQAQPVIIEDDCFIGAHSEIAEGAIIGQGSVIGMNTFIGLSTKIIDRETGQVTHGRVPPHSVVVPGSYQTKSATEGTLTLNCAVIIRRVTDETRKKTALNDLLRS